MKGHREENDFYYLTGLGEAGGTQRLPRFGPVFTLFNFLTTKAPFSYPEHRHDEFEMIMPIKGRYQCRLNGALLRFEPGKAVILQPGDTHRDDCDRGMEYAGVRFFLESPGVAGERTRLFKKGLAPGMQVFRFGGLGRLRHLRRAYFREKFPEEDPFAAYQLTGMLQTLFWESINAIPRRHFDPAFLDVPERDAFRQRLLRLFESNPNGAIELDEMARLLRMSKSGLCHRCKASLGIAPAKAHLHFRLAKARRLLEEGIPVLAASEAMGFANPFHFSRAFKRFFGKPPSALKP